MSSNNAFTRRAFFGTTLSAAALATLAACASSGAPTPTGSAASLKIVKGAKLTITSYGDPVKLGLRQQVVEKFNSTHSAFSMDFEGFPTINYFDKLATQFSAGNPPDVINMDPVHLAQYAGSGQLAPLDDYVPKLLETDTFDKLLLNQGMYKGKLYGCPVAESTYGMGYDVNTLKKLGMKAPTPDWTYDDFEQMCKDAHKEGGSKMYGSEDASGDWPSFEVWLRAHGKALYKDAKVLGFSAADLKEWWTWWGGLRSTGGCVPADVAAEYKYDDASGGPVVKGLAVFEHIYTPNFSGAYQALTKDTLKLLTPPLNKKGGQQGTYQSPSSVMTMSTKCAAKPNGAQFIDWFTNSTDSASVLQFISGPPASKKGRDFLAKGTPDAAAKEVIDYTNVAHVNAVAAPPLAPAVDAQVNALFLRTAQDIAFKRTAVADAVTSFIQQGNQLLKTNAAGA